jgi:tRNA pseudouridine55 synthase
MYNVSMINSDILLVDKPEGLTPLQALGVFREKYPEYANKKITYAGRLDPMASGLLLFLSGSAILEKEKYLNLNKKYMASILLGFETDSFDILGLVTKVDEPKELSLSDIRNVIAKFVGMPMLSLPPYSSPPVEGVPLHALARKGLVDSESTPTRVMQFDSIEVHRLINISGQSLRESIPSRIGKVSGDFRQHEILERWTDVLEPIDYQLVQLTVECQSGSYIRSLAHSLGRSLGTAALLYELRREKIGEFELDQAIKLV